MNKNYRLSTRQPLVQGEGSPGSDNCHSNGPAVHTRGGADGSVNTWPHGKGHGPSKAHVGLTATKGSKSKDLVNKSESVIR